MDHLNDICCVCLSNNKRLKHLFNIDNKQISYYSKLITTFNEMNFKEMNDHRMICSECCNILELVYKFRGKCLRAKEYIISYTNKSENVQETAPMECSTEIEQSHINMEDVFLKTDSHQRLLPNYFQNDELNLNKTTDLLENVSEQKEFSQITTNNIKNWKTTCKEGISQMDTKYECTICNKIFQKCNEIDTHMLIHSKNKHVCEICQKSFTQVSALRVHILSHSGEKKYICTICDRQFMTNHNLSIHLLRHTGEKRFVCKICDKKFTQKSSLKSHTLVHSGERPFVCELCGKKYTQKSGLKTHMSSHVDQKQLECHICHEKFMIKNDLTKHLLRHTSEAPRECDVCKKILHPKTSIEEHMKAHPQVITLYKGSI